MKAEVVYAFAAATLDEITLQVGEIVDVISVHDGGWGFGFIAGSNPSSAGKPGYFPVSYVQFLRPAAKQTSSSSLLPSSSSILSSIISPSSSSSSSSSSSAFVTSSIIASSVSGLRRTVSAESLLRGGSPLSVSGDSGDDLPPPPPSDDLPASLSSFSHNLRISTTLSSTTRGPRTPTAIEGTQQQQHQPQQHLMVNSSVLVPRSPVSVSSFFDLNRSRIVEYRGDLPWAVPFSELSLEDCIGAGAFGAVYRGTWRGQTVAIKKMLFDRKQADSYDQPAALTLFQKEAEFLRSFSHENIVEFKGACLDHPNLCLVMEYAINGSLFHYIHRNHGKISPQMVFNWVSDIAEGMNYLVNEAPTPIIHRDLKSQNVLVTENLRLKITDFGVAKAKPNHSTKMSTAGTFAWMAPEAIKFQNYSEASDVWSFGVILWELLTLEVPYANIEPYCIAYGVATRNLKLPIPSTCPPVFRTILEQCWQEDRKARPYFADLCETLNSPDTISFSETPPETFDALRTNWTPEISSVFEEIRQQESKIKEKEEELMRAERDRIAQEVHLKTQQQLLEKREEDLIIREHLLDFNARKQNGSPDRILKSRSMPEIAISIPFGFRHVAHVGRTASEGFGLDVDFAELEPDWMEVVQRAGVSQKQLNDGELLQFVIDFTLKNSDPKEVIGDLVQEMKQKKVGSFLEFGLNFDELRDELNHRLAWKLSQAISANKLGSKTEIPDGEARVLAFPESITVGETVSIRWVCPHVRPRDWLGLHPHKCKTNKEHIFRHAMAGKTFGLVTVTLTKVGRYDTRIVDKAGKTLITGNSITVKEKMRPRGSTWSSPALREDIKRSSFFGSSY